MSPLQFFPLYEYIPLYRKKMETMKNVRIIWNTVWWIRKFSKYFHHCSVCIIVHSNINWTLFYKFLGFIMKFQKIFGYIENLGSKFSGRRNDQNSCSIFLCEVGFEKMISGGNQKRKEFARTAPRTSHSFSKWGIVFV